jgi:hypothetical protein
MHSNPATPTILNDGVVAAGSTTRARTFTLTEYTSDTEDDEEQDNENEQDGDDCNNDEGNRSYNDEDKSASVDENSADLDSHERSNASKIDKLTMENQKLRQALKERTDKN